MTFKKFRELFIAPMKCNISIVRWEDDFFYYTPYNYRHFDSILSDCKLLDKYLDFEVARIEISDNGYLKFDLVE